MLDTIFESATIIDGSGLPPYCTDVAIAGERIALIGDLRERDARVRLSCTGRVLAPGFIDVHSHSDQLWLVVPGCDGKIAQGVTTEVAGNCGTSPAPLCGIALQRQRKEAERYGLETMWESFDEFFSLVNRQGVGLNVASLVGLGTTRCNISGDSERKLEPFEIAAQAQLVREACEQGVLGVSSGLIYPPSSYADTEELIAMTSAAREGGAPLYASHVRDEGDEALSAISEAIAIGSAADVAVQCSHHKAQGRKNWGKVHQTLAMVDRARASGLVIHTDVYPYVASWTELATMLPAEVRYGGVRETVARLSDPLTASVVALKLGLRDPSEWHEILITSVGSQKNSHVVGMRMDDIASHWAVTPQRATIRLLREEQMEVEAVFFTMCEDDVASVLSADFTCIGSDASVRALQGVTATGVPHPRTFGTFPRVFGRFVRGRKTLSLQEAVRRMTSLPSQIYGIRDRGVINEGAYADLVVFDAERVADTATYEQPYQLPIGIDHVFVNGTAVKQDGALTGALPGHVLRSGKSTQ
ncbi:MAG: D-aminoacylase [Candidatus Eremiobacteraeota bacterium]|nr:D-aminoacylase [Candidatus Eremiobacteraeota bacterium]